jgi:hypothetical protein
MPIQRVQFNPPDQYSNNPQFRARIVQDVYAWQGAPVNAYTVLIMCVYLMLIATCGIACFYLRGRLHLRRS